MSAIPDAEDIVHPKAFRLINRTLCAGEYRPRIPLLVIFVLLTNLLIWNYSELSSQ